MGIFKKSLETTDLNSHEADKSLNIKINNSKLSYDKTPKFLGVYLDRTLTYQKQVEKTADKLKMKNCLIQNKTGTSWSASRPLLKIFSLALCYTLLNTVLLSGGTAHIHKKLIFNYVRI